MIEIVGSIVSVDVGASPVSEISSTVRLPTHDIACHMVSEVTPAGGVSVSCTPVAVVDARRVRKNTYSYTPVVDRYLTKREVGIFAIYFAQ